MKTFFILILLVPALIFSAEVGGSFSTGLFMGTPFWNSENAGDLSGISSEELYLRSVNQLRLNGRFAQNFSFRINALRSDGFTTVEDTSGFITDVRLDQTKIYEASLRYDFSAGFNMPVRPSSPVFSSAIISSQGFCSCWPVQENPSQN